MKLADNLAKVNNYDLPEPAFTSELLALVF